MRILQFGDRSLGSPYEVALIILFRHLTNGEQPPFLEPIRNVKKGEEGQDIMMLDKAINEVFAQTILCML